MGKFLVEGGHGGRGMDASIRETMGCGGHGDHGDPASFLTGGGQMGALMRARDWSRSPLGEPRTWPQSIKTVASRSPIIVTDLPSGFVGMVAGAWDKPPAQAAIVPVAGQGQNTAAGFLVVGINPYRRFDDSYGGFLSLMAGQIASGIANATAYEDERKRAEALAELDRAKTTFFSNVSHEFRTPLTLMLSPLEELLAKPEGAGTPQDHDLVELAHRNALRLLKLVNMLLDFSRIEAGRVQASYQPTDLAAFTTELASNFRSAMDKGRAHVRHRLPASRSVRLCRPGHVGEARPQSPLQCVQVHLQRRDRGRAAIGGRRGRALGARHRRGDSRA
jgi:signal transduction histidine kinase